VRLCPPTFLVTLLSGLGQNDRMGLSGRPPRPLGSLSTSKVYVIAGRVYVFYPIIQDQTDFYMSLDELLWIDTMKSELAFLRDSWRLSGRPTICVCVRERTMHSPHARAILALLSSFKMGVCGGVRVRAARLQQLLPAACFEYLSFVPASLVASLPDPFGRNGTLSLNRELLNRRLSVTPFFAQGGAAVGIDGLGRPVGGSSDQWRQLLDAEHWFRSHEHHDASVLRRMLPSLKTLHEGTLVVARLLTLEGPDSPTNVPDATTTSALLDSLYNKAVASLEWSVVRTIAGIRRKVVDSLAPSITELLVRDLEVSVGSFGGTEFVIAEPMPPSDIHAAIFQHCTKSREAVMQQEVIIFCCQCVRIMPEAFNGMLRVRIGWIVEAMVEECCAVARLSRREGEAFLYNLSPFEVKALLMRVLGPLDESPDENGGLSAEGSIVLPFGGHGNSFSGLNIQGASGTGTLGDVRSFHSGQSGADSGLMLHSLVGSGSNGNGHGSVAGGAAASGAAVASGNSADHMSSSAVHNHARSFVLGDAPTRRHHGGLMSSASISGHGGHHLAAPSGSSASIHGSSGGAAAVVAAAVSAAAAGGSGSGLNLFSTVDASAGAGAGGAGPGMTGTESLQHGGVRKSASTHYHHMRKNSTDRSVHAFEMASTGTLFGEGLSSPQLPLFTAMHRSSSGTVGPAQVGYVAFVASKWMRHRRINGWLNRVPAGFYGKVWNVLSRCTGGISCNGHVLSHETVEKMTSGERNFALAVEGLLNGIPRPERRQMTVELLSVVAVVLMRVPELNLADPLVLDDLLVKAAAFFSHQQNRSDSDKDKVRGVMMATIMMTISQRPVEETNNDDGDNDSDGIIVCSCIDSGLTLRDL
jgi:hypothetical protein